MTEHDFNATFQNLAAAQLPPPPDARQIALQVIRRDRRRTRVLAVLSVFFWLVAAAGMLLLVYGLNRLVIFIRIDPSLPWNDPTRAAAVPGQAVHREMMFWGTQPIHQSMPYLAAAVIALMLAALCTVLLVFSSREATLNRINLSLAQMSEQLRRMGPALPTTGISAADPRAAEPFSLDPPQRGRTVWPAYVIAALAVVIAAATWTGHAGRQGRPWQDAPRLSPFEAVRWQDQTTPQVRVGGTWYELRSIDGVPIDRIMAFSRSQDAQMAQKHFDEDLVELMTGMGHPPKNVVTLEVKEIPSGAVRTLKDVPMTEENRMALLRDGVQQAP